MAKLYVKIDEEVKIDKQVYVCKNFTSCMACDLDVKHCDKVACSKKDREDGIKIMFILKKD